MKIEKVDYASLNSWAAQYLFEIKRHHSSKYSYVPLRWLLHRSRELITIQPNKKYKQVTIRTNFQGACVRMQKYGFEINTKKQYVIREGQLLVSKIDARNGAFALVSKELSGAIITANFWAYVVEESLVRPSFLIALMSLPEFLEFADKASNGSTGRHYLQENSFLDFAVPLPSLVEQDSMLHQYEEVLNQWTVVTRQKTLHEKNTWMHVKRKLGIESLQEMQKKTSLCSNVISFSEMQNWDVNVMNYMQKFNSVIYPTYTLNEHLNCVSLLQKGQRPRYTSLSSAKMINQKCVRMGYVDMKYAKSIDDDWSLSINGNNKTRLGDILICSTGNGTLGRAALVDSRSEGFLVDSHVLLLRLYKNQIAPVLLCYLINSQYGQKQIERLKTARTTNQTELGVTNLLKMKFPFPPIKIQNQLSAYILKRVQGMEVGHSFSVQLKKAVNLLEQLIYD